MKRSLLKNYKALILGGIAVTLFAILLSRFDFTIINPDYVSEPVSNVINVLGFAFCWWVVSFLMNKFPIYQVLGVLSLLLVSYISESLIHIPNNPITIPFVILFWLGMAYLILPQFFKKYRIAILSIYGVVVAYFLVTRPLPNYLEDYHENFLNFMLVPIPVFGALWIFEQWRWLRTLKADKAKTELTLLKNQIDPHFFFNTLNNLYGLAVEKSDKAPEMILKLSDIMRYTIYEGQSDYVPLKNEITYLEDYIELHKIRYQKTVEISFHKDIQHQHEIAPLLLVIPLENAFKHGVESLAGHAFIDIQIQTTPSKISFKISNNYEASERNEEGIGLDNLKKRLALIYPNHHQLQITQTPDSYTVSIEIESHEVPNH